MGAEPGYPNPRTGGAVDTNSGPPPSPASPPGRFATNQLCCGKLRARSGAVTGHCGAPARAHRAPLGGGDSPRDVTAAAAPPPFILNPGFCRRRRPPPLAEGREGADAARAAANRRRRRAREGGARPAPTRARPRRRRPVGPRFPGRRIRSPGEYHPVFAGRFPG